MTEITSSSANFELRLPFQISLNSASIIGHTQGLEKSGLHICINLDPAKVPSDNEATQAGLTGEPLKDIDRGTLRHAVDPPATELPKEDRGTLRPTASSIATELPKEKVESLPPRIHNKSLVKESLEKNNADKPVPVTAAAMEKDLGDFAAKDLKGFDSIDPAKAIEVAAKAAEKAPQIAETFHVPKTIIPKIAKLAYYDHKILCDDSGSMTGERSRIETLEASVRGVFKIATSLSSDTDVSLVPFEGRAAEGLRSETDMEAALRRIKYDTGANVPRPLQKRILDPLLEAARAKKLRPTIVSVITDGDIGGIEAFSSTIEKFKHKLIRYGYTGPAVVFLICRVGSDTSAAQSLLQLKKNETIRDIVLYSEDKLDAKFQEANKDINKFAGWVIGELIHALELQLNQKS